MMDPYSVLGLPHSATLEQIKKAYHTLARKYHPDRQRTNCEEKSTQMEQDFANIAEAYTLLTDPQRKAQYDHIYKYGGYDDDIDDNINKNRTKRNESNIPKTTTPGRTSRTTYTTRERNKRPRKGIGYACNDPVFTYLFSQGKIHTTKAVAGIEIPSRFALHQVRIAFSSGQAYNIDPLSGQRIYTSQTVQFENGQQQMRTEKTVLYKDGRREVIMVDRDEQGRSKKKYYVSLGKPLDEHNSSWYTTTWQELKDRVLMCYGPCTAVTN